MARREATALRHPGTGRVRRLRLMTWTAVAALLVALGVIPISAGAAPSRSGDPGSPAAARPAIPKGGTAVGSGGDQAVIVRDKYGVPSIYAGSMAGVWFGAGYAQAEDRMVQLELTRRTVEGTLSAIFGSGEVSQDEDVRTFFYTQKELAQQVASLPASAQRALTSFSDGINAYEDVAYANSASEKKLVPYEMWSLGKLLGLSGPYRPEPWQPLDTVAVGDYLAREFGGGGGSELSNLSFLRYLEAEFKSKGRSRGPGRHRSVQRRPVDRRPDRTDDRSWRVFGDSRSRLLRSCHRSDAGCTRRRVGVGSGSCHGIAHERPAAHPADRDLLQSPLSRRLQCVRRLPVALG